MDGGGEHLYRRNRDGRQQRACHVVLERGNVEVGTEPYRLNNSTDGSVLFPALPHFFLRLGEEQ